MSKQPIFLTPTFQERIWGGTQLETQFKYNIPSNQTGECWAISAHPNGQSMVRSGEYKGSTLGQLWTTHPSLFGNYESDRFPLLTKILDANTDLSVQVHPNDEYAMKNENGELGKTECWYIIDCEEEAELIFGHHAQTKEQFKQMVDNGEWNELLRRIKIKPGDFFYVPSGTIHALCKGTLVLETQQSSDTTYRVYDYDRRDAEGNLRELHLEKSIEVATVPFEEEKVIPEIKEVGTSKITKFVESSYFTVYKWDVDGELFLKQNQSFLLASVIDGSGFLTQDETDYELQKGDHFILPFGYGDFTVKGNLKLIVSHP